jgi:hypothetical protein
MKRRGEWNRLAHFSEKGEREKKEREKKNKKKKSFKREQSSQAHQREAEEWCQGLVMRDAAKATKEEWWEKFLKLGNCCTMVAACS